MVQPIDLTSFTMGQLAKMLFEAYDSDENGKEIEAGIIAAIQAEVKRRGFTQSELVAAAPDLFGD